MVIKQLRTARENHRKLTLIIAFISIYVLWCLCFVPYDTLELYYQNNKLTEINGSPVLKMADIKVYVEENQLQLDAAAQRLLFAEAVLSRLTDSSIL